MSQALPAQTCERRALSRASLLDAARALDAFAEAEALWSRLGARDGVCRTWVCAATLQLRGLGNLHEAALWLEQARRARGPRGSDAWAGATLARADLLFLRGDAPRAAALVDVVARALEDANRPPRALIAAALQGIAVTRGAEQDRFARLLCAQLERVMPASGRLALLDRLDICPPLSGAPELRVRLRSLVPSPACAPQRYPAGDRARLALRDADLDRVAGRADDALLKLEHAWRKLGPDSAHALAAAAARTNARRLAAELAERALARTAPAEPAVLVAVAPRGPQPAPGIDAVAGAETPGLADGVALVQLAGVLDDAGLQARVLGAAQRLLGDRAAGAWPARLLELRARDAASAELALELRRRAAGIYEAMGDDVRRDRALGRPPSRRGRAPSRGSVRVAEHELCVTARVRGGRLTLTARDHAGNVGVLRGALAVPAATELQHPAALGRALAAVLRDAVATVAGDRGDDVGLRALHPAAGALPWELAAPAFEAAGLRLFRLAPHGEAADVTAVQGALSRCHTTPLARDGNLGPETSGALSRFQGEHGLPRTGLADPVTVQRLHGAVTGGDAPRVAIVGDARDAEAAYAGAGYHPLTAGDDLATLLREQPVAVLHIHASLTDHHGTPALDLPTRLTGIALDRKLPRDLPAPLVVLDVPAQQRNAFATQLAAIGTVRAILAAHHPATVAEALRSQRDIYDVTRAIRARDATAALFARNASIRFPRPR